MSRGITWAYRVFKTPQLYTAGIEIPRHAAAYSTSPFDKLFESARSLITPPQEPTYPTHIPLSPIQKGAVAVLASLGAFADPRRADLVATVGETTALPVLRAIRDRMSSTESGRQILHEKPRVTNASVAHAWDMPPGTFGAAYASFMGDRGFQADERPAVRFIDDPELAYIVARAREVHDFWHTLFDLHTNVFGEAALKAVEFMQTGLPMTAMAVVAGEFRLKSGDRRLLNTVYLPWAWRAGSRCVDLMPLYYEKHFHENLDGLRRKWQIEVAPKKS